MVVNIRISLIIHIYSTSYFSHEVMCERLASLSFCRRVVVLFSLSSVLPREARSIRSSSSCRAISCAFCFFVSHCREPYKWSNFFNYKHTDTKTHINTHAYTQARSYDGCVHTPVHIRAHTHARRHIQTNKCTCACLTSTVSAFWKRSSSARALSSRQPSTTVK